MPAIPVRDADAAFERARADYLAVSRGAHLFATSTAHREAEEAAWTRLEAARAGLQGAHDQDDEP